MIPVQSKAAVKATHYSSPKMISKWLLHYWVWMGQQIALLTLMALVASCAHKHTRTRAE